MNRIGCTGLPAPFARLSLQPRKVDVVGHGPPAVRAYKRKGSAGATPPTSSCSCRLRGPVPLRFSIPSPSETKESGILCTLTSQIGLMSKLERQPTLLHAGTADTY
jgi:hypothetical protein